MHHVPQLCLSALVVALALTLGCGPAPAGSSDAGASGTIDMSSETGQTSPGSSGATTTATTTTVTTSATASGSATTAGSEPATSTACPTGCEPDVPEEVISCELLSDDCPPNTLCGPYNDYDRSNLAENVKRLGLPEAV